MKKIVLALGILGIIIVTVINILISKQEETPALKTLKEKLGKTSTQQVDHSSFDILKTKFTSPQSVTEACISCHNKRDQEVMQSNHWNWEREEFIEGRGIVYIGKKNAVNNYCIGVEGNEQSCAKCHIGFGMTDSLFSFTDTKNIDCLVCHDNTETYVKANEKGGAPDPNLNFNYIAQNVGQPKRSNCGVCHFFGGGGNNVKHGDLESAMFEPSREVDVHMDNAGMNLQCTDCHRTEKHNISGKMYSLSSMNRNRALCEDCHGENPHEEGILNEHTVKVACQTCHIPVYAKVNATKLNWDWSTAGKLKDGKPYTEDDSDGNHSYMSIKGSFKWGKNVKPDYIWFNGTADHYLLGDIIADTNNPLKLNTLMGEYADKNSKIIPVKIHYAMQPFDPITKMIIQPKLFSDISGEGAFWTDFNWVRASEVGMKEVDLPFSGQVSFIKTEMYWPVNHMVSTKELSLSCNDCHQRENGRLADVKGFYMPVRDYSGAIETAGFGLIAVTLFGVVIHGALRVSSSLKRRRKR